MLRTFRLIPSVRPVALLLLASLCTACGMNLRPEPLSRNVDIAGHWQLLDGQRTTIEQQLRTAMEQARAKQEKRNRRREPMGRPDGEGMVPPEQAADTPDGPGNGGPGARRDNWEQREQREQETALLNAVLPSSELRIVQQDDRLEFTPAQGGRRRFDRGVRSTLVSSFATLRIESGWQANVFVVHSHDYAQKIDIVERYSRQPDGLLMQVLLNLPDTKDQVFEARFVPAS